MITLNKVSDLHIVLEKVGACRQGVRDLNLLHSAIDGQHWFTLDTMQYCYVAYCINAYHIFTDGNKRTAYLVMRELESKGVYFDTLKLAKVILKLATDSNTFTKESFYDEVLRCSLNT